MIKKLKNEYLFSQVSYKHSLTFYICFVEQRKYMKEGKYLSGFGHLDIKLFFTRLIKETTKRNKKQEAKRQLSSNKKRS